MEQTPGTEANVTTPTTPPADGGTAASPSVPLPAGEGGTAPGETPGPRSEASAGAEMASLREQLATAEQTAAGALAVANQVQAERDAEVVASTLSEPITDAAGNQHRLSPAIRTRVAAFAMQLDNSNAVIADANAGDDAPKRTLRQEFMAMAPLMAKSLVPIGTVGFETGAEGEAGAVGGDAQARLDEAVQAKMKESDLEYDAALSAVTDEKPELAAAVEREHNARAAAK